MQLLNFCNTQPGRFKCLSSNLANTQRKKIWEECPSARREEGWKYFFSISFRLRLSLQSVWVGSGRWLLHTQIPPRPKHSRGESCFPKWFSDELLWGGDLSRFQQWLDNPRDRQLPRELHPHDQHHWLPGQRALPHRAGQDQRLLPPAALRPRLHRPDGPPPLHTAPPPRPAAAGQDGRLPDHPKRSLGGRILWQWLDDRQYLLWKVLIFCFNSSPFASHTGFLVSAIRCSVQRETGRRGSSSSLFSSSSS